MAEVIIRVYNSKLIAKPGVAAPDWFDLDVDQATSPLKLDISAVEIGELGTNFGIGSQQFALPNTPTNNDFFNYAFDIGSDESGFTFQKSFACQILVDGGSIASGKLYFDSVTTNHKGKHFYNCTFSDAVSSITDVYKDTLLADLNWSAYTHNFTIQNVTGSWDNLLFSGSIIYPNVLYGYPENDTTWAWDANYFAFDAQANVYITSNNIPLNAFKPAVRVKTIFDKIFDSINYEYESNFITNSTSSFGSGVTASFSDLYMLMTPNAELGPTISTPVADAEHFKTSAYTVNLNAVTVDFNLSNTLTGGTEVFDPLGMINFNVNNLITLPLGGNYRIEPSFTFRTDTAGDYIVRLKIVSTGQYWDLLYGPLQANTDYTHNQSIELTDIVAGYSYEFKIEVISQGVVGIPVATFSNNNFKIDNVAYDSGPVDVSIQFGDLKVADFLKGLSEQFNLVWWADKENPRKVYIEPWSAYIKTGNELDWSNKVDYSVNWEISHPSADAEKTILFANVEDDDSPNQYYIVNDNVPFGSYTYQAQSDYAEGEKTIGNSFFAPTIVKPIPGTNAASAQSNMTIPHIYTDGYLPRPRLVKFKPRLLFKNGKQNYSFPYTVANQTLTTYYQMSPVTTLNYGAAKFDLNFSSYNWYWGADNVVSYDHYTDNDSFNVFWANYINNIYRNPARKVTLNIKFEPVDLFSFRVNDVIFIDGQTYLINKISGFDLLKPASTQVELIKALYPSYNKPVFIVEGNDDIQVPGQGDPGDNNVGNEWVFEPDTGNPVRVVPTDIVNGSIIGVDSIKKTLIRQQGFLPSGSSAVWKNVRWDKQTLNTNIKDNLQYGINAGGVQSPNTITLGGKNDVNSVASNVLVTGNTNTVSLSNKNLNVIGDNNNLELGNSNLLYIGNNSNSGVRYFSSSLIMDISSGSNNLNKDSVYKVGIFALNKGVQLEGSHNGSVVIANINSGSNVTSIGKTGYSVDNSFFMGNDDCNLSATSSIESMFVLNNGNLNLTKFTNPTVDGVQGRIAFFNNETLSIDGGLPCSMFVNTVGGNHYPISATTINSIRRFHVNDRNLTTYSGLDRGFTANTNDTTIRESQFGVVINDSDVILNGGLFVTNFNNQYSEFGRGRTDSPYNLSLTQESSFINNWGVDIRYYDRTVLINNRNLQAGSAGAFIISSSAASSLIGNANVGFGQTTRVSALGNRVMSVPVTSSDSVFINNDNSVTGNQSESPIKLVNGSLNSAFINNRNTTGEAIPTRSIFLGNENLNFTGSQLNNAFLNNVRFRLTSSVATTSTYINNTGSIFSNGDYVAYINNRGNNTLKGSYNFIANNNNVTVNGENTQMVYLNNTSCSVDVDDAIVMNNYAVTVSGDGNHSAFLNNSSSLIRTGDNNTFLNNNRFSNSGSHNYATYINNYLLQVTGSTADRNTIINSSGSISGIGSGNTIINLRRNNHIIGSNKTIIGFASGTFDYSSYYLNEDGNATIVGTPIITDYVNQPNNADVEYGLITGKQFHYGPQYHGYKFLVGTAGGTLTVDAKANTYLLSWFSTAGTATVNLPLASSLDGIRIIFKGDNSISATKIMRLTATGGETIDGAATYDLNLAYEKVTIMAMDGVWYIIES